jgi:hypothetical protein
VAASVLVPAWITPAEVYALSPDGLVEIPWSRDARVVRYTLAELQDVAMVVIAGDSDLAAQIRAALDADG